MEECGEDQGNNHENQWARSNGNCEETNEADFTNVDASQKLLESARVYQTLGVDLSVGHEENIVLEGAIEQAHSDGSEAKDERRNTTVHNT